MLDIKLVLGGRVRVFPILTALLVGPLPVQEPSLNELEDTILSVDLPTLSLSFLPSTTLSHQEHLIGEVSKSACV